MFHPMTTGMQVASHDAWLAEMQKEPTDEVGRVARPAAQRNRLRGIASRLAGLAHRLGSRRWPQVPVAPERPAEATGAGS